MPKVSIIIPAYNVESFISDCVNSVLCQTEKDIEVIVVDDGSTDRTYALLKEMASHDSRLIILKQTNKGQPEARNKALDICSGDYIQFVDSDDTLIKTMTEELLKSAIDTNADITVCSYYNIIKYKDNVVIRNAEDTINTYSRVDFCLELYKKQLFNPIWNKLYRREAIKNLRFENIVPGQDLLYNLTAYDYGCSFHYLDKPLYNYYSRGDTSIVSTYKPRLEESKKRLLRGWEVFLNSDNPNKYNKDELLKELKFEKYLSLTLNIYRRKSPMSFSDRSRFIRDKILLSKQFKELRASYKPNDKLSFFYLFLVKTNNSFFINAVLTIVKKIFNHTF